ncbi:MAG: type II toxin-antitoxin system RelB/DinJ family antitoxin [Pseudomonadota bacterium]|nr:type II toxin-antitoxin system RelB/DinJ family antitoxin [Pseudomonadota bacterium]
MTTSNEKIRTNVYLDSKLKAEAKQIFKQYGLGLSEAFNIFLGQAVAIKGLPFEMRLPNDKTAQAIQEVRKGENLEAVTIDTLKSECEP